MSKGLDTLKQLQEHHYGTLKEFDKKLSIIEKELKRLARIDDLLEEIGIDENDLPIWFEMQKQDGKKIKALEIIKDKSLYWDIEYQPYEEENDYRAWDNELYASVKLTKEEYDLLREVLL